VPLVRIDLLEGNQNSTVLKSAISFTRPWWMFSMFRNMTDFR